MKEVIERKCMNNIKMVLVGLIALTISSCCEKQNELQKKVFNQQENEYLFNSVVKQHLNAVSNKDLNTLKSTLSPKGDMILILPNSEVSYSVNAFIKYHEDWFKETNWTFETKLLKSIIHENIGIAVVEAMYRESERNGKPFFNRMVVSYALERIDNKWYVIKDHACSIERSNN